jgi:hypothetical protein
MVAACEPPDVAGTFEVPPALQADIASAAAIGAKIFNDRITEAPC